MTIQELRYNEDGTLDEVVISDAFCHLEQMGKRHWWLGISRGEGKGSRTVHVNFRGHKGGRITVMVEDEGLGCLVAQPEAPTPPDTGYLLDHIELIMDDYAHNPTPERAKAALTKIRALVGGS